MRVGRSVVLDAEQIRQLEQWYRGRSLPARLVERARIVLLAAKGKLNIEIGYSFRYRLPKLLAGGSGFWMRAWNASKKMRLAQAAHRECDALVDSNARSGDGVEWLQRAAHLEREWIEAASDRYIQSQQQPPLCRQTRCDCRLYLRPLEPCAGSIGR